MHESVLLLMSVFGSTEPTLFDVRSSVASLIGRLGSSTFRLSTAACRCCSRARASLRNRHQGPSIMGFEDEAEQSIGRPCRQTNGGSKRPSELTSSIVPRGTSCHHAVELEFPPIGFDPARFSCCCRNWVPSIQMRYMITANRRASATTRQSKHRSDGLGFTEASGYVNGGAIGQRHHGADTRGRHQAAAHLIIPKREGSGARWCVF